MWCVFDDCFDRQNRWCIRRVNEIFKFFNFKKLSIQIVVVFCLWFKKKIQCLSIIMNSENYSRIQSVKINVKKKLNSIININNTDHHHHQNNNIRIIIEQYCSIHEWRDNLLHPFFICFLKNSIYEWRKRKNEKWNIMIFDENLISSHIVPLIVFFFV